MARFQFLKPSTWRLRHYRGLSPDEFERLIFWLARRCGEFGSVQWYSSARDDGRDVVATRRTDAGREKWYIRCQPYRYVSYDILHNELNELAEHARRMPGFTPHVIVLATGCDVPPRLQNKAATYARALGLAELSYWGERELDHMLESQPETREEFFGRKTPLFRRRMVHLAKGVTGWVAIAAFCALGLVAAKALSSLSWSPRQAPGTTPTVTLTSTTAAAPAPAPTDTPTATPTATSTPAPTPTPTSSPTPIPTSTSTPVPTDTPIPTPTTVRIELSLLEPKAGNMVRTTIFRWKGEIGPGQFYVVHLRHLDSNWTWQSGPLRTNCLETSLQADMFGGWRWQVSVMQGNTIVAQSEEVDFWYNPFPQEILPTQRPCSE